MGYRTDIIEYNLKDRGRQHVGQHRNFNIPKVVELINSKETQELVDNGDLVGYLGHDVRLKFGMRPKEVCVQGDTIVALAPAIKTTYIKAYSDGRVQHQEEFLDTPLGKSAQSWYESKVGGFSSVFTPNEQDPQNFYGFDFVMRPNYTTNRGYVIDGIEDEALKLDLMDAKAKETEAVLDALAQTNQVLVEQYLNAQKLTNDGTKFNPDLVFSPKNWIEDSIAALDDASGKEKQQKIARANSYMYNWMARQFGAKRYLED